MLRHGAIAQATVPLLRTAFTYTRTLRAEESGDDCWKLWYSAWSWELPRRNYWPRCQCLQGSQPRLSQVADCTRAWASDVWAGWRGLASSLERSWTWRRFSSTLRRYDWHSSKAEGREPTQDSLLASNTTQTCHHLGCFLGDKFALLSQNGQRHGRVQTTLIERAGGNGTTPGHGVHSMRKLKRRLQNAVLLCACISIIDQIHVVTTT